MVAGFLIFLKAILKIRREEEKEEKKEPKTLRQNLIAAIALIITAFIGLVFLKIMDYLMALSRSFI